jgi:TetR/AcrR family transcriptional repressor of nem operon
MTTTKEQILDVASKLIHVRGFKNTSVDDILRETGVGKGNFYYYFKSKDELGYAILDRMTNRINTELIEKTFDTEKDPWDQICGFLDAQVLRVHQNGCTGGCLLGNLAAELSDIHEEFRQRLDTAFRYLRSRIERALAQAQAQGSLRAGVDISRMAHFIVAGFEGALMMGKLYKDPAVVEGIVEEVKGHLAQHRVA